jgi:hypothetical protein
LILEKLFASCGTEKPQAQIGYEKVSDSRRGSGFASLFLCE